MGGRALKKESTFTRRYQRDEFETLKVEVFAILEKTFKRFDVPRFFFDKESFGDMDIIVSMEGFNQNMNEYITETFSPNEIFHNGNAWSFDYKEIQIDFITCDAEHFNTNYHYMAFNDLGNLTGRLAQKLGLKYGQEGLWYNHYYNGQNAGRILISKDYPKIFEFLGLDYDTWVKGFYTLEEIFKYVTTSKFFNPEDYQWEKLNKINRERNMKRTSYVAFLDYVKDMGVNENYDVEINTYMKENIIHVVDLRFPEAKIFGQIAELEAAIDKKKVSKDKFNGGMIIELFGIQGKELGDAMYRFKDFVKDSTRHETYDDYILENDYNIIVEHFKMVNEL